MATAKLMCSAQRRRTMWRGIQLRNFESQAISMASAIVPEILSKDNYDDWSVCMKNYLRAQDLWDIIEGPNSKPPNQAVTEAEFKAWMKKMLQLYMPFKFHVGLIYILRLGRPIQPKLLGKINNEYNRVPKLLKYINQGDWHSVGNFIDEYPNVINAKITSDGQTPLHKATCEGKVEIVGKLVKLMSPEALAVQDVYGNTALHYAAARGMTRMARYMVEKNDTLVTIANNWGIIPTLYACAGGQRDMTAYLLTKTSFRSLSLGHASVLLQCAIVFNMFGKSYTPLPLSFQIVRN
ncbi:unnamed protein product [Dovyalis caffra]|uniref:DUF4219 domain-containing protein n=1 Tax=Dovyalis caffra TaxID=77055 RepID=A0AAV1RR03_9ROSI|nr:unnamed protein product [Dovyalis caffra]